MYYCFAAATITTTTTTTSYEYLLSALFVYLCFSGFCFLLEKRKRSGNSMHVWKGKEEVMCDVRYVCLLEYEIFDNRYFWSQGGGPCKTGSCVANPVGV